METKAPQRLGKGCLCLRLKALGNNNQDLSLGNHHSNIEAQVGERCFLVELGGRPPAQVAPCASSLRSLNPDWEKAEAEQSLAGRKAGFKGRSSSSRHRALSCCRNSGDEGDSPHAQVRDAQSRPHRKVLAAQLGCPSAPVPLLGAPPSLLSGCRPTAGCKQYVERRKCWIFCTGSSHRLLALAAPCAAPEGLGLLPGRAPAPPRCRWAALQQGALALLALAPATSLPPELLSLDKYAFNNQAVFV